MDASCRPEFRPAHPDEQGRAGHLDSGSSWKLAESRWFAAVIDGPPERIVGAIRYAPVEPGPSGPAGTVDFRLVPGPGAELAGHEEAFLDAFVRFAGTFSSRLLRYTDLLGAGHILDEILQRLGFSIRYREARLETPWQLTTERVARVADALRQQTSPLSAAKILPARACEIETALPLLERGNLMNGSDLRSIWRSPDPTRMDRDASACLVLGGETLGVVICADAGDHLRIKAIIGDESIAGARRRAIPLLMDHAFRTCADRGYEKTVFRANSDQARQTVNLGRRLGGHVTGEARRWGKLCAPAVLDRAEISTAPL
jgi:hypothetical protein